MAAFLYRCPNTGLQVQAWTEIDEPEIGRTYETVICTACQSTHLVNPATGNVIGGNSDDED